MYCIISGKLLFESEEKAKQNYDKLIETENSLYGYFPDNIFLYRKKIMLTYFSNFISYSVYEDTKSLVNEVCLDASRGKITVQGGDNAQDIWESYYVSPAIMRKQSQKVLRN